MNPGIAYTIGQNWEAFCFENGGIVGLTFAAAGFLAAYTTGVYIVKRGIQKGNAELLSPSDAADATDRVSDTEQDLSAGRITTSPGVLESLSFHIGLIGATYLLTYLFMMGGEAALTYAGAANEASTLWSFHFVFAAILALGVRKATDGTGVSEYIDDVTMTRISNFFMDLMITASVAAISLTVIGTYWLPLLLISLSVVAATWWTLVKLTNLIFSSFRLERFASIYGNMTGTLQSGLLLLRILDEKMESPVSYNLVYGSGLALVLGFPLLILINAPVHYFESITAGFGVVLLVMAAYLLLLLIALFYLNGKKGD
jgi:ESS family glutamate:Na+ symporter